MVKIFTQMLDEEKRKAKVEYNMQRDKELGRGTFGAKLEKEERDKINDLLIKAGMNKAEFIRFAYKKLKEELDLKD